MRSRLQELVQAASPFSKLMDSAPNDIQSLIQEREFWYSVFLKHYYAYNQAKNETKRDFLGKRQKIALLQDEIEAERARTIRLEFDIKSNEGYLEKLIHVMSKSNL